ncbi:MAG: Cof-type HAD-IIB family hydrolase, partial [Oscillospiraceae bacterium]
MRYKLIVSDFDNTICNRRKMVTQRTKSAIKQFTDNGGRFVVCTTRPYIGIAEIAKKIGLRDEIIANQGATVRNLADNSVVFQSLFTYKEALEIIRFFDLKSKHIFLASDFQMKSKTQDLFMSICEKAVKYPLKKTEVCLQYDCTKMDVAQIIVGAYSHNKVCEFENLAKIEFGDKYEIGICDKYLLNLTQKGVSKGRAIQRIADIHSIKREEIIAFGDSLNDSSMFEFAGVGVAMGNAMQG